MASQESQASQPINSENSTENFNHVGRNAISFTSASGFRIFSIPSGESYLIPPRLLLSTNLQLSVRCTRQGGVLLLLLLPLPLQVRHSYEPEFSDCCRFFFEGEKKKRKERRGSKRRPSHRIFVVDLLREISCLYDR